MFKKFLAGLATLALGAGVATITATPAAAKDDPVIVGTVGTAVPWSESNNHAGDWTNYGTHVPSTCVDGSSTYGTLTDGGLTVTLKPYDASFPGDHYELLVIKAGNVWNYVTVHPSAGVAYASPVNNGGQQATVSHWFVCFGTYPVTQPQSVAVSGTPTDQECVAESKELTAGSILLTFTGPSSGVTVTYRKQGAVDPAYLAVGSNPLTGLEPGTYEFLVEPVSSAYTTTTPSFTVTIAPDTDPACDLEVKAFGDPSEFQECVRSGGELDLTSEWVATLTIDTADTEPAGSVQYRVLFWNDATSSWDDQGIWPEGVYTAGPGGDFPYGKVRVVAEAVSPYQMKDGVQTVWEYDFSDPITCDEPTLGTVTPVVTFAATCSAAPTFTLAIEGGDPGTVTWRVNGGAPFTQLGTFPAPASTVTVVASPTPPAGFDGDGLPRTFTKTFGATEVCGDLTTLALTGGNVEGLLWISALLGLLGTALVRAGRRTAARS